MTGSNTPPVFTSPAPRNALNSLPEVQGRRVDAYLILGKTYRQIAREEGVDKCAVRRSVKSGITHMKKYLRKNF